MKRRRLLIIVGLVLIVLIIPGNFYLKFLDNTDAPELTPMRLFKVEHHHGCWQVITDDSCYTAYYYVGMGSLQDVERSVYMNLSKAYSVEPIDNTLYVNYKKGSPAQNAAISDFRIEFMTAPKSSDPYHSFFIPTKDCVPDSPNCVEAQIIFSH